MKKHAWWVQVLIILAWYILYLFIEMLFDGTLEKWWKGSKKAEPAKDPEQAPKQEKKTVFLVKDGKTYIWKEHSVYDHSAKWRDLYMKVEMTKGDKDLYIQYAEALKAFSALDLIEDIQLGFLVKANGEEK